MRVELSSFTKENLGHGLIFPGDHPELHVTLKRLEHKEKVSLLSRILVSVPGLVLIPVNYFTLMSGNKRQTRIENDFRNMSVE